MFPEKSISNCTSESAPDPRRDRASWKNVFTGFLGSSSESRWGAQLIRISSDMIVICDEDLRIRHHNRAFLKAIGHTSGSFCGQALVAFVPESDRESLLAAFGEWRSGHAAGMRFQTSFLTNRGMRNFDVRAVRSRDRRRFFTYYLVAREAASSRRSGQRAGEQQPEPFFTGLPVAAWRTDSALCITSVYGDLWSELGEVGADSVGKTFGLQADSSLPAFLQGIDCADALTGMSFQTEVTWRGERFSVTVEPFLDSSGGVLGTVGFLRRSPASAQGILDRYPTRREIHPVSCSRHHLPPWAAGFGISVVTGRVPKLVEDGGTIEGTDAINPTGSFSPRRPSRSTRVRPVSLD